MCLEDVDFAENCLPSVPDAIYKLKSLRKLDISGNKVFFKRTFQRTISACEERFFLLREFNTCKKAGIRERPSDCFEY